MWPFQQSSRGSARHLDQHVRRSRLGTLAKRLAATSSVVAAITVIVAVARPATNAPSTPGPTTAGRPTSVASPTRADDTHWTLLLHRLDRIRAQAWREERPRQLVRVFAAGSQVLAADREALREYARRGLRVTGVRLRVADVRVVSRRAHAVRLRVVDQLGAVEVHDEQGRSRLLPRDEATLHALRLTRTADGWRIATVRAVARR